jgi:hypothetical protein
LAKIAKLGDGTPCKKFKFRLPGQKKQIFDIYVYPPLKRRPGSKKLGFGAIRAL